MGGLPGYRANVLAHSQPDAAGHAEVACAQAEQSRCKPLACAVAGQGCKVTQQQAGWVLCEMVPPGQILPSPPRVLTHKRQVAANHRQWEVLDKLRKPEAGCTWGGRPGGMAR